jgi:cytochrome c556
MRLQALCVMFAVTLGGACAPKKNLPVSEIPKLTKLEDVMDVQATVADPLFKKASAPSCSDADWAAFADASVRLQATAVKIKDFSKGADFDALAARLHDQAGALGSAATAKDVAGAQTALRDLKSTCKECHKKFR